MLTTQENDLLCRVEGEAPMGQIMRRHWLPACLSEEVEEADGDPVRLRLLGEDLLAFRDSDGKVGVIGEFCSHRNVSLFFGRNEECGLRCIYHGWKVDVEGNIVEMSSEPSESGLPAKVKHKSHPVREAGGVVWAYMGPADSMPEFEAPLFAPTPDTKISIVKILIDCNLAQILEGAIDSAHSSSLHASDMLPARVDGAQANDKIWFRPSTDKAPKLFVETTNFGFRYAAIRRPITNAHTHDYVRTTLFIAPYSVLIPPNDRYRICLLHAPMDDTHTAFYFIAFGGDSTPDRETWRKFNAAQIGIDVDATFKKTRVRANNYLQDRKAMKAGNWTGIPGIPNQDIVMWEPMGPIADRSKDRLGASDVAIAAFRKMMLDAAKTMAAGGPAIGTNKPRTPYAELTSFEGLSRNPPIGATSAPTTAPWWRSRLPLCRAPCIADPLSIATS